MPPTVSVNLCCYNSEKYLRETLDSIVNQTNKDWELIIINDGSSDSTESIIRGYINRGYPVVYHFQANAGLSRARNKAIELSNGEFIAFIDHDDLWMPEKLERQICLFADSDVGLVFSDALYFDCKGNESFLYDKVSYWTGKCFSRMLATYFLCISTVIIRRTTLEDDAWFDPRLTFSEEADLFLRIAYKWKIAMVSCPLAKKLLHTSSITESKGYLVAEEIKIILNKYENIIPDFKNIYAKEVALWQRRSEFGLGSYYLKKGDRMMARRSIAPYKYRYLRGFLMYMSTFMPMRVVDYIRARYFALS